MLMRRLGAAAGAIALMGLATATFGAEDVSPEAQTGEHLFHERCALCHAVGGADGGGQGPNLAGVVGRKAGATDFSYSRALRTSGLTWDPDGLDHYLTDPHAAVPGTTMPVKVRSAEDRTALIAYLATLKAPQAASEPATTSAAVPADDDAINQTVLAGREAFGDWRRDAPGVRHRVAAGDLPAPFATRSSGNPPRVVDRPADRNPKAPPGFRVDLFADGLDNPRVLRVAPNGDVFLAETATGLVRVLRAADGATHAASVEIFAHGLDEPFGIAFYPPGPEPHYVYVAETNRVLRFPYRLGDVAASGPPEVVVPNSRVRPEGTRRATLPSRPMGHACSCRWVPRRTWPNPWGRGCPPRRRPGTRRMGSAPPGGPRRAVPTC